MAEPMFRIIASTRRPGVCRSPTCAAAITWCRTFPNQKAMPLHGDPVALKTEHDNDHGTIEYIASADSHWAHCVDAPKFGSRK